jgi:hypothetical protein
MMSLVYCQIYMYIIWKLLSLDSLVMKESVLVFRVKEIEGLNCWFFRWIDSESISSMPRLSCYLILSFQTLWLTTSSNPIDECELVHLDIQPPSTSWYLNGRAFAYHAWSLGFHPSTTKINKMSKYQL